MEGARSPPDRRRDHARLSLVLGLVAVANALPLFCVKHLPFTDLPEHVAAMATIARLLPGGGGAPYVLALGKSQYLLYHLCGALLTRVVGDAVLANKLVLGLVALAWPLSMRRLLRALGRDERIALFAPMVFWNRALAVGFLPFIAALPLALFALAVLVDHCRQPTRRRAVSLVVLTVVLFYAHASAYLVFVACAGAVAAAACWVHRPALDSHRPTWRPLLSTLPLLLPSAVAAGLWWSTGSLAAGGGQDAEVVRMAVVDTVSALPMWTFDIWKSHLDEVAAALWWGAFSLVVIGGLSRPPERGGRWVLAVLPFAVSVIVYVATPHHVGAAGYLNVRLAPLVTLLALATLRPREDRWGTVPLGMAALATLIMAWSSAGEIQRVSDERLGDFDALLAKAKPGARLAMLDFQVSSPRTQEWPYVFAGSLYRARGGAVASYSFTDLPHWPVHYAPDTGPPPSMPFWVYRPCAYRYRTDGMYYDYVLVQGEMNPWDDEHRPVGPMFAAVATSGVFTLYAKVSQEDATPDAPERGPCMEGAVEGSPSGDAVDAPP